jgi:hypothetical protein
MRFAFSLLLIAIGVSFLLPSDAFKAALFVSCGVLVFLLMRDSEPTAPDVTDDAEQEYDDDERYDPRGDRYSELTWRRG